MLKKLSKGGTSLSATKGVVAPLSTPFAALRDVPPNRHFFCNRLLLCLAVCAICFSGCVHRRMTVRTNPPGALLYVDDHEIGTTPVSASFVYYGKRKIRLVKDGYETLTLMQDIPPPWYEFPPLDFIAENFVPGQIRDQRMLDFQLHPQTVVPTEQLLSRAEALRRGVHAASAVAPPQSTAPQSTMPETIPAPEGVGGHEVHPVQPR